MGKTIRNIIKGLSLNGAAGTSIPDLEDRPPQRAVGKAWIANLTPEERQEYIAMAHTALRTGLTVFMSAQTVESFARLLKTEVTSRTMRRLLEAVGKGEVVLVPKGATTQPRQTAPPKPVLPAMHHVVPTVLSIDQLSAGMPFTLRQAAKILNVTPNKLYFRCVTGRIHFERDGSRYFIPATEVQRLQVIGL